MNNDPSVIGEHALPSRLKIYDTTLRDGEQTIGVSFSKEEKLKIAQQLDLLGVDRIEAGMPVISKEDQEAAELIVNAGLNAEVWGFCRSIRSDIDACAQVGIKHVICEIATSDIKMQAYGINRDQVLKKAIDAVQHAKSHGMYTAFFAVDSTRADIKFLETIFRKVAAEGQADEMVIVDTIGVATPETMYHLTRRLKDWVGLPIMTHCHNDFGMAVSCTLFSAKGGADCAHVTVNGLGEKTGNTDLAELVMAAKLYGMESGIDLTKLYEVSKSVEALSGIPISPIKPIVGENIFKRESGVTAAQLISYPPAVEGYSPEVVGRERGVLLSKKSGRRSVEYKLKEMDKTIAEEKLNDLLNQVKTLGIKKKGLVSDEEFATIVEGFL